jgi:hypothetical protein
MRRQRWATETHIIWPLFAAKDRREWSSLACSKKILRPPASAVSDKRAQASGRHPWPLVPAESTQKTFNVLNIKNRFLLNLFTRITTVVRNQEKKGIAPDSPSICLGARRQPCPCSASSHRRQTPLAADTGPRSHPCACKKHSYRTYPMLSNTHKHPHLH